MLSKSSKTYTTISGDTWDMIAYKVFGDESYTDKIMKLNMQYINTVVFASGVKIALPEKIVNTPTSLPKWKGGRL